MSGYGVVEVIGVIIVIISHFDSGEVAKSPPLPQQREDAGQRVSAVCFRSDLSFSRLGNKQSST